MTIPLQTQNLTKTYGNVHALENVSLTVNNGEFLSIMGTSGSGKSTLLHLIAGLMSPSGGNVLVNGEDIYKMSDSKRTQFRLKNVGIIFQAFNLIPTLTAEENITLPCLIAGQKVDKKALDDLLGTLEITERRKHRPDSLSGGEQQRVAVGRALFMNPAVILADEPTGNLDSVNGKNICELLRKLCDEQKRTLVVVTHDSNVAKYGGRTITLKDGRMQE